MGRRRKRDWPSVHVFLYFTGPGLSRLVFDRMATRMRKMGFFIWEMHIYHRDLNWLEKASMKVSAPSLEAVRELLSEFEARYGFKAHVVEMASDEASEA